jgi:hypothetical protein
VLAFLSAALVGLVVPSGCVMGPEGGYPSRESVEGILFGPDRRDDGSCSDAMYGTDGDECACDTCRSESEQAKCPPPRERRKLWERLPKLHLYDPEAGIFNFCIPPQCINPPAPLPPGRFFPVPVRPAFAPRQESSYGLLSGDGDANGGGPPCADAPVQ